MSIVRENLMERKDYTPYCGADNCRYSWPRTRFTGTQFRCGCGWKSNFEAEFIDAYKKKWKIKDLAARGCSSF